MLVDIRKTSEVIPNLNNMKPYRTKAQKQHAHMIAVKNHKGYYNSYAPRSFHPIKDDQPTRGNKHLNEYAWNAYGSYPKARMK